MSDDIFSAQPQVLSVTQLNRLVRELLEASIPLLWVSGEISNFTRAASGHWYFSLKDASAQVRCVMFRGRNAYLDWQPREGDKVEARALVSLYEARGDFQLTIEFLQRAGLGALFEAFEKLKNRLEAEGLFAAARKRPLPSHPRQIGIISSPDAAAVRDVLSTLRRRQPGIRLILYPTAVQGRGAAEQIAQAIRCASHRRECDVLIVCRGGGSLEDLWSFNEEVVARAVAECALPVISGVGHETDFTICDFVADVRAPTPTAAAELASPDRATLLRQLQQTGQRLRRQMQAQMQYNMQKLDLLAHRLIAPAERLQQRAEQLRHLQNRLQRSVARQLELQGIRLQQLAQNLQHLSPQQVLHRGYSLVRNAQGQVVSDARQLDNGARVSLQFAQGGADATVTGKHP